MFSLYLYILRLFSVLFANVCPFLSLFPTFHSSLCLLFLQLLPSLSAAFPPFLPSFTFISLTFFLLSHSPVLPFLHYLLLFPFLHLVLSFPFPIFFIFISFYLFLYSFCSHPSSSFLSDPSLAPLSPSHTRQHRRTTQTLILGNRLNDNLQALVPVAPALQHKDVKQSTII